MFYRFSLEMQMKAGQSVREVSQSYLDETGSLISSLERVQRERLSKTPPPHLSNIMPPSDLELQLGTFNIFVMSSFRDVFHCKFVHILVKLV